MSSGLPPDEERRLIHAQLDRHYRQRLDEPIPMLGNISPRKAAKTAKGRAKITTMTSHGYGKSSGLPICANDQFWARVPAR